MGHEAPTLPDLLSLVPVNTSDDGREPSPGHQTQSTRGAPRRRGAQPVDAAAAAPPPPLPSVNDRAVPPAGGRALVPGGEAARPHRCFGKL